MKAYYGFVILYECGSSKFSIRGSIYGFKFKTRPTGVVNL